MASASHIPGVTDLLSALGLGVAQTDTSETADVHKSLDAARATIKTAALSSRAPSIESHVSTSWLGSLLPRHPHVALTVRKVGGGQLLNDGVSAIAEVALELHCALQSCARIALQKCSTLVGMAFFAPHTPHSLASFKGGTQRSLLPRFLLPRRFRAHTKRMVCQATCVIHHV